MLGMFYTRKVSKADRNQALVYRSRMESGPKMNIRIWDDSGYENPQPGDTIHDVVKSPDQLITSIKTNLNMASVRFIRFMQELEIKYGFSFDDRIDEMDHDGNLTFHLNNIDGWHP